LSQARLLTDYVKVLVSDATSLIVTLFRVNKALEYRASDIQDEPHAWLLNGWMSSSHC